MLDKLESEENVKNLLKNHFIDDEMYSIMKATTEDCESEVVLNNFNRFLELRESNIKKAIEKLI